MRGQGEAISLLRRADSLYSITKAGYFICEMFEF
jgi:hypothetical protein